MDIPFSPSGIRDAARRLRLPRRAFRLVNLLLAAAVCGLGGAAYLIVRSAPAKATPSVRTAAVTRSVVLSSVSATGSIVAPHDLGVDFAMSGRLTGIAVTQGQHVRKGQVLGRLDDTTAGEAVQEAQANLATADANLAATRAGVTPDTKRQDAISLQQASSAVNQATAAIAQAKQTAAIDAKSQAMAVANARRQLRTDRGNEVAYVAAVKQDNADIATAQAAYNSATATATNDQSRITADKASIQGLTNAKNSLSLQQTRDQQQLNSDQATLDGQSSASGKKHWQAIVDADQSQVNADAIAIQQNGAQQSSATYQESLDESALTTDQQAQSTALTNLNDAKASLTSDQQSITTFEGKIVGDKQSLASATLARQSAALKDKQSVATAKQQVASARLSASATAVGNRVKEAPATASTLAQQEAAVLQARAGLADAQRTLSDTVLRSPVAGTIAAVSGVVGQQMSAGGVSDAATSSSGNGAASASSFVTLLGVSSLEATAAFAESDAAKLRVGQPATVTVPALANTELPARVIELDAVGTSSSGVVEYNVTVALDRRDARLKPGMTANVSIVTAERDNVLTVPSAAVTGSGADATVTVVDAKGVQTTKRVVAGLQGDSTTQIVSGLTAGQQVVVATVSASSLTSTTSGTQGRFGGGFGGGGGAFRVRVP